MTFWFFHFEGRFRPEAPTFGGKGLFSTCLVPLADREEALALLLEGLDYYRIDLLEIKESEEIDPDELDPDDADHQKWLKWCEETTEEGTVLFDPWQVYDE